MGRGGASPQSSARVDGARLYEGRPPSGFDVVYLVVEAAQLVALLGMEGPVQPSDESILWPDPAARHLDRPKTEERGHRWSAWKVSACQVIESSAGIVAMDGCSAVTASGDPAAGGPHDVARPHPRSGRHEALRGELGLVRGARGYDPAARGARPLIDSPTPRPQGPHRGALQHEDLSVLSPRRESSVDNVISVARLR